MHSRDGIEALGMLYIIVTVTYLCGVAGCSCRRLCGRIILLCRVSGFGSQPSKLSGMPTSGQLAEPATKSESVALRAIARSRR